MPTVSALAGVMPSGRKLEGITFDGLTPSLKTSENLSRCHPGMPEPRHGDSEGLPCPSENRGGWAL